MDPHRHDDDRDEAALERELAALADGSLPSARAAELRARAAQSPELARALETQRHALAAVRAADVVTAPARLHAAVAEMAAEAERRRRRAPRWRRLLRGDPAPPPSGAVGGRRRRSLVALGAVTAAIAVLAVALVVVLGSGVGPSGPSSADAARVALRPPTAGPPAERPSAGVLAAAVDGVAFPYWGDGAGWRGVGTRRDVVGGRMVATVFYADAAGRRIGYAIASGDALPVRGGRTVVRDGVWMRLLRVDGAPAVTWMRHGHTCVLAGRGIDSGVLIGLASRPSV